MTQRRCVRSSVASAGGVSMRGLLLMQSCGARTAVVPLWGAAVGNQRRQPLLGRGCSAGAAGLVAVPPRGASGAACVRGRLPASRRPQF